MAITAKDTYLDMVQAAVEDHPTWDVDEILLHVFKHWTKQEAEVFIDGVKADMRWAEEAREVWK